MPSRPSVIAHRGASAEFPENSLPAFLRAIEFGADAIELDVHSTNDGVVVVHHDPVVVPQVRAGRTGASPVAIASMAAAELADIQLAPGVPIPFLADVLDAIGDRATVYVEIKGANIERAVVETLAQHRGRCAVHSFDHRAVRRVRELAPALRTGILLSSYLLEPVAAMRAAHALDYWQYDEFIDAELVERITRAGGEVIAWTVNDVPRIRALAALGVAGICTDRTREACAALMDLR